MVAVWDRPTRLFHWLFAASVIGAWGLADVSRDLHEWLGYLALALVAFRLYWGWSGNAYARFSAFTPGFRELLSYIGDLMSRREKRYLGHNPLGALMVFALLSLVVVASLSGWYLETDAGFGSDEGHELHEWAVLLLEIAVPLHVVGVILTGLRHRENLVRAMIHGRKRSPVTETATD